MGDTPINLEIILEQAPKWTFAGDFTLLQWMKQISQDLENRAAKTTDALTKLDYNIRSTNLALDNVANSLTTLQFGNQFVESRVQDDDETSINCNEAISSSQNQAEHTPTSKEMLNIFLENNLKVLRNCHEKYTLDLEDSDDEGNNNEKTCIYQPINPYNDKPLPFIYGSKDWHAKWHVGLYENQQENTYSGDEISEAFSESSSTSHIDDNESFESNTEWASSNSMDNDYLNTNIEVKNASSLRGSQPLYPGTPSISTIAGKNKATISDSSSISTPSSSLAKKSIQTIKQTENLTQRSESINSINSKNSTKVPTNIKENNLQYNTQPKVFMDLFVEPPEDVKSTTSSSVSSAPILTCVPDNNRSISTERPQAFRTQPPSFVDLFDEPPEDLPSSTASSISSVQNIKRKTVNLFDDDEDDMPKEDLLSELTKKKELDNSKNDENKNLSATKFTISNKHLVVSKASTSQSLFDDSDEDDDDFLKAFVKKSLPQKTTKTLLFDNEIPVPSISKSLHQTDKDSDRNLADANTFSREKHSINKISNIFEDDEDKEDDLLVINTQKVESKTSIEESKLNDHFELPKNSTSVIKLNESDVDDYKKLPEINDFESVKVQKKINLFDDLNEEGCLFSIKSVKSNDIFQETVGKNECYTKESVEILHEEMAQQVFSSESNNSNLLKNIDTASTRTTNKSNDSTKEIQNISHELDSETSLQVADKLYNKESNFESPSGISYPEDNTKQNQKELNNNETTSIIVDKTTKTPDTHTENLISSNKYEFNSILFLEEPPEDDNEFFETLSKTPHTLNTNYNAIDLENDVYEPELPKVPLINTSNIQADTTENIQSNLYSGLQLFSDIPPDDDAGASDLFPNINETKRLHSVFYDDFNETIMALNQNHNRKEISSHSIFSDQPPPINKKLTSSNEEIIDHKEEIIQADTNLKSLEILAEFKESITKTDDKNTSEYFHKRPISKLKVPHININVQALLPGANNTLRKVKEENTKSYTTDPDNNDIKSPFNISKANEAEKEVIISKVQKAEVPRTSETKHILPSVTKNRVKAPTTRRPSTRRARQENYRNSLIEQQRSFDCGDETSDVSNKNKELSKSQMIISISSMNSENMKATQEGTSEGIKAPTTPLPSEMFEPKQHNDDLDVIRSDNLGIMNNTEIIKAESSLVQNIKNSANSLLFDAVKNSSDETYKIKPKSIQAKSSLFVDDDDEDEEDDDLFKHIKPSTCKETNITVKGNNEIESVKSSSVSQKINSFSSSAFLENNTNIEVTKLIQEIPTTSADFLTETGQSKSVPEKPQSSKDNENLLNKFHVSEAIKTKHSHPVPTNKFNSSFFDDEDEYLFKTNMQTPTSYFKTNDRNIKAKSEFRSFLDSESDEGPQVAGLQTKTPTTHISTVSSSKISKSSMLETKNTSNKLFADSDTDSDDLFGKLSLAKSTKNKTSTESKVKTQEKTKIKSSLFGDESDSDDFLTTSKSVSKNTESSRDSKDIRTKKPTQTNASIFSDLDSEEEDLFGSGSGKTATENATNISNVSAPSTSKPTPSTSEVSKSKTVDDNPLADLL